MMYKTLAILTLTILTACPGWAQNRGGPGPGGGPSPYTMGPSGPSGYRGPSGPSAPPYSSRIRTSDYNPARQAIEQRTPSAYKYPQGGPTGYPGRPTAGPSPYTRVAPVDPRSTNRSVDMPRLPIEERLKVPLLNHMQRQGNALINEGRDSRNEPKMQMGMERVNEANERLNRMGVREKRD